MDESWSHKTNVFTEHCSVIYTIFDEEDPITLALDVLYEKATTSKIITKSLLLKYNGLFNYYHLL